MLVKTWRGLLRILAVMLIAFFASTCSSGDDDDDSSDDGGDEGFCGPETPEGSDCIHECDTEQEACVEECEGYFNYHTHPDELAACQDDCDNLYGPACEDDCHAKYPPPECNSDNPEDML